VTRAVVKTVGNIWFQFFWDAGFLYDIVSVTVVEFRDMIKRTLKYFLPPPYIQNKYG
jgi:hypothetical protein